MWDVFAGEYLERKAPLQLKRHRSTSTANDEDELTVEIELNGAAKTIHGVGNGPIAASQGAGGYRHRGTGSRLRRARALGRDDARAAAYVEAEIGDEILWGVGIDVNIVTASLQAVVSAVNRA